MRRSAFAPAKINLFLHVGRLDPLDGKHPVSSLMVFADVGDTVSIEPADHPEFVLDGDMADGLADSDLADNLVVRARDLLLRRLRRPTPPFRLVLSKRLPTAAGLGGGSSDAGATLRLVRDALELSLTDEALEQMAGELGADGPACLRAAPVLATGRGEQLAPSPRLPVLDAVLVNPNRPCGTGAVYRAFDAIEPRPDETPPPMPDRLDSPEEVAAWLGFGRNDLEAAAIAVCPEIADVLAELQNQPETLLARLSGSGATAFALCSGGLEAEGLAERLSLIRPDWWVRRCRLGGPWPT